MSSLMTKKVEKVQHKIQTVVQHTPSDVPSVPLSHSPAERSK